MPLWTCNKFGAQACQQALLLGFLESRRRTYVAIQQFLTDQGLVASLEPPVEIPHHLMGMLLGRLVLGRDRPMFQTDHHVCPRDRPLSDFHHPPTIHANHPGRITHGFPVDVLMAVEQEQGLVFKDVIHQAVKTRVQAILPVMDTPWGIMGDQDVNGREGRHELADL